MAGRGKDLNAQSITGDTPLLHATNRNKVANVDALLKLGADPIIQDGCGLSAFDYFIEGHPIRSRLESWNPNVAPMDEFDRNLLVKITIRKLFSHFDSLGELLPPLRWRDYLCLALQFLRVPDETVGKVLLETLLCRLHDGRVLSEADCSECENVLLERPLHLWRKCYFEFLCHTCYLKRADSNTRPGCPLEHTYLEFGGAEWWALPKGLVNAAGQTIDTWLASVKVQYITTLKP